MKSSKTTIDNICQRCRILTGKKPCDKDHSPETVLQYYNSFEDMLDNFKFDDGAVLLEVLKLV